MTYYYVWFLIFSILAYLIATDNSVSTAFLLVLKIVKIQFERIKWLLMNDPRNPINKYLIWRRSYQLAKELQNEIEMERKSRASNNNSKTVE